jgi:hypothetical protein
LCMQTGGRNGAVWYIKAANGGGRYT